MQPWTLCLDFGTATTVAAIRSAHQLAIVEFAAGRGMPSAVGVDDHGALVVGDAVVERAEGSPECVEQNPKRLLDLGQAAMVVGGRVLRTADVVAAVLAEAWREAARGREPGALVEASLTHPASWGSEQRSLLREAAAAAGLPPVWLIPEPWAAASYLASEAGSGAPVSEGAYVAVYDLGGGTFEATVLQKRNGRFAIVGEAAGDKLIGGDLFDDRLYHHLGQSHLPADIWNRLRADESAEWRGANRVFRRQVRCAKEALSYRERASIQIPAPVGRELRVTRGEFEQLIRTDLDATLDILASVLDGSGVEWAALAGLYAVGGSSRIPLVTRLLQERFGRADQSTEPETAIALGGAYRAVAAREDTPHTIPPYDDSECQQAKAAALGSGG